RQQATLAASRAKLEAAGISTNRLAVHERELATQVDVATQRMKAQQAQLGRMQRAQERARKLQGGGMKAAAYGAGMTFAGQRATGAALLPVRQAMDFESAMAEVRKVVDGLETPEAFSAMGRDVENL